MSVIILSVIIMPDNVNWVQFHKGTEIRSVRLRPPKRAQFLFQTQFHREKSRQWHSIESPLHRLHQHPGHIITNKNPGHLTLHPAIVIVWCVYKSIFPTQCLLAPKAQKGITKGERSRGWLENVYTSRRVYVCACARACLQLTYVAMAILRKRSPFMI